MIDYTTHRPSRPSPPPVERAGLAIFTDVMWIVCGIVAIFILSVTVGQFLVFAAGYVAPAGGLLVLVALAILGRSRRRARAMTALNYLEQAVRLNLPIPAMLEAAEAAERGALRRRLGHLRLRIETGQPIAASLAYELPGLPPRTVGLVRAGEELGQLPLALARIVETRMPSRQESPAQSILLRWYPVTMLVAIPALAWLIDLFVMPKFKQILSDFGVQIPAPMRWFLYVSDRAAAPLMIFVAFVFVVFCGRMLSQAMPSRTPAFWMWRNIADRIGWVFPVYRNVVLARGMADLCHLLAGASEAGQPFDRILTESADACGNTVLARRVRRWNQAMTLGVPPAEAARRARMPGLFVRIIETARGEAAMRNALVFLARYYDYRQNVAAAFLRAAAVPLMVGVTAIIVTWVALSVFLPMVALINQLPASGNRGAL